MSEYEIFFIDVDYLQYIYIRIKRKRGVADGYDLNIISDAFEYAKLRFTIYRNTSIM